MSSCQRCKQTSNGPQAFLLTCRGCNKTWHHRCHMPPVDDEELIRRIRATNAGDTVSGNDLSAWTCRRCGKKGVSGTPSSAASSREQTASSESREDSVGMSLTSLHTVTPPVKQDLNMEVDVRLVNDRERNEKSDRQEATEAAPVTRKRQLVATKTARLSAANRLHVQEQDEESDESEATETAPVTRKRQPLAMKTARPSAASRPHVQEQDDESDESKATETAPVTRKRLAMKTARPSAASRHHVQEQDEESDESEATEAAPVTRKRLAMKIARPSAASGLHQEQTEESDESEATEAAPVIRQRQPLATKTARPSAASRPHVQPQPYPTQPKDGDMRMADTTPTKPTPQEKRSPQRSLPQIPSHQGTGARRSVSTVSTTPSDDVEMKVDVLPPTSSKLVSRTTPRASQATSLDYQAINTNSVAGAPPPVRAASTTNERDRKVRPPYGATIQSQVNQDTVNEVDDDPEDLYGPPVERRIIRILPSLAEELREQQRRAAAEKEKRRAPLAPDWIFAKHLHDPSWKEIPTPMEGRRKRKPVARRLGDNGLDANDLLGCFTVRNWVRDKI